MLRKLGIVLAAVLSLALGGCGYNELQRQDEGIKAAWSEVVNQYQRRADLVPNLVNTVKGYAQQEQTVLTEVTNARANVGSIKVTPELINDPAAFQKYIQAQNQLQGALSRLIAVAENYPTLKSNENVKMLMEELSATENKVGFSRQFYNDIATNFNTAQQVFPTNILAGNFGFKPAELFEITDAKEREVPTVDLSRK